jgi:uncharacterized membrane protein
MTDTAPPEAPPRPRPPANPGPRVRSVPRRYLARLDPTGTAVAVLLGGLALTPSLIPRSWLTQGLVSGLCALSGYGIGVLLGWVVRSLDVQHRLPGALRTHGRRTVLLGSAVVIPVLLVLGVDWQHDARRAIGAAPSSVGPGWLFVLVPLVAVVLFVPVLGFFRWLRRISHRLTSLISRRVPASVARVVATVAVVALTWGIFSGVVWERILDGLNASFSAAAASFDPDLDPPTLTERSGSPDSPETWASLEREGRRFVTRGPTPEEIAAFQTGLPSGPFVAPDEVGQPIRVYAGMGENVEETAGRVVAELDRTDAWDRASLLVVTTTGTGWVDPPMADTFELLHGGDTAIAAMQYSNLPSWLSFIGDRVAPANAGRALFEAVYDRWSELPEDDRPRLFVAGISLGSFGMQAAFSGGQDLAARTDGAMFVGTPSFSPSWQAVTADRDPGSQEVAPVYRQGEQVRWLTGPPGTPGDPLTLAGLWETPRAVYVQHGSDAVTWWSPDLLWSSPDWLNEPRARDVAPNTWWIPVTTFWQVTFDMFFGAGAQVPMGAGHHFELEYADGFAAIAAPVGWTPADTLALREAVQPTLEEDD